MRNLLGRNTGAHLDARWQVSQRRIDIHDRAGGSRCSCSLVGIWSTPGFLTGLNEQVTLTDPTAAVTHVDIADTIRRTYGYAKQGSGYGYCGVTGLNTLLGTVCSADRAPVIVVTRLRQGSANSTRGAARLVADSLKTTGSRAPAGR